MRGCKTSSLLLWVAASACLGACWFRLGIDRTGWDTHVKQLTESCLQMLACVSVFLSLLVHARFVIHVSAEPPEFRPSIGNRAFHAMTAIMKMLPKPRLRFPIKKARKESQSHEKSAKKRKQPSKSKTAKASIESTKQETTKAKEPTDNKPATRKTTRRTATKAKAAAEEPKRESLVQEHTTSTVTTKPANTKVGTDPSAETMTSEKPHSTTRVADKPSEKSHTNSTTKGNPQPLPTKSSANEEPLRNCCA